MHKCEWWSALFFVLGAISGDALAADLAPAAATVTAVPLTAEDVNVWLDGYMPHALGVADIAGSVVVVVKDGEILTERGFGYSDVEKHLPVDPKLTLFRPGSVSKLFTWTAVMQQVEQGKIDLDADINTYLDFKIPPRDGKPITVRNLMQHTAGFEEQAKGIISEDPKGPTYEQLLKQWTPKRVFPAGDTQAYSNYGASLAAYIVQRVSGESFYDYLDKHVFEPLQMRHSTFRQPLPSALAPFMSKGYKLGSGEALPFEIIGPAPAGSMSSPGEDMAHFMIAHLQGGEYHGARILSAETVAKMHDSPLTLLPPLNRMELGFFETNINGHEVIGHLGDTDYFHTSLHLFINDNVGFYVSFNSLGKEGAAGTLRNELFNDFSDRYFPAAKPMERVDAPTAAAHAALLKGNWSNSRGSQSNFLAAIGFVGQVKVGLDAKGHLVLPFKRITGKPREWVEVSPFLWIDPEDHERLAAKVENGKAVRWSIDELSPFMVFQPVPWYADAAWLMPVLMVSVLALLLTAVFWPINAVVRRRFGAKLVLDAASLKAYRGGKWGAISLLVGLGAWVGLLAWMINDTNNLSAKADAVLHFVQLLGIVTFLLGLVLIAWNLKAVWGAPRRWPARVWSLIVALSAIMLVWVGFVCQLFQVNANY